MEDGEIWAREFTRIFANPERRDGGLWRRERVEGGRGAAKVRLRELRRDESGCSLIRRDKSGCSLIRRDKEGGRRSSVDCGLWIVDGLVCGNSF